MYDAWEMLPERLQQRLDGVQAEFVYRGRKAISTQLLNEKDRARPPTC